MANREHAMKKLSVFEYICIKEKGPVKKNSRNVNVDRVQKSKFKCASDNRIEYEKGISVIRF